MCTLSMWLLVMFSGDVDTTPLFSEQDEFDQRTGMIGTNTAADDKEMLVILQNRFLNMHRSLKESPHDFVY